MQNSLVSEEEPQHFISDFQAYLHELNFVKFRFTPKTYL